MNIASLRSRYIIVLAIQPHFLALFPSNVPEGGYVETLSSHSNQAYLI